MPHTCAIPGCRSRRKDFKLFLGPYTDKTRWEAWKKACPFLENYGPMQLQNVRFCPKHFSPEHINEKNYLTKDAIPALHLTPIDDLPDTSNPDVSLPSNSNEQSVSIDSGPSGMQPPLLSHESDTQNLQTDSNMPPILNIHCGSMASSLPQQFAMRDKNVPPISEEPGPSCIQSLTEIALAVPHTDNISHSVPTTPVRAHCKLIRRRLGGRHDVVRRVRLLPSEVTPRKKILRDNNKILKSKLRLWKSKYYNIKRKSNLINCPKTLQFIKKYRSLNNFGKLLVDSQLRLTGVKPQGRRYTTDEKIFSLSLSKLSRKCYAHLRKFFVLPCKSTLNSLLTNVPLRPGINDFVFQHLADAAVGKSETDKQCVLLFDEMAINKNLHFNFHTGVIEGFEDLGSGQRSSNVADKALVFMLRGLFSNWKFPVAFYFARGGMKTFVLKNIVKEIIITVFETGFCVRATVSDQGSANVAAIKSLTTDTRAELLQNCNIDPNNLFYKVNNNIIYHIFDVPHLLKCFRNNFQKKDVLLEGQKARAQWKFLEQLYTVDGRSGKARSIKLTDKHLNPQSYDKMKVNEYNFIRYLGNELFPNWFCSECSG